MTHLLREAAEVREERERARLSEDALLTRRETAALLGTIRAYGRPNVPNVLQLVSRRPSGKPRARDSAPWPAGCVAPG